MLNTYARGLFTRMFTPLARWLLSRSVTPDMVTVVGTIGVMASALILYPLGHLFIGTLVIAAFVFADLLDGTMARLPQWASRSAGRPDAGRWGSFLDSSLDRLADGAIFSGVAVWFFTAGDHTGIGIASLVCMFLGSVVSYVRAKAESLGFDAEVGIAERAERLVLTLTFVGLTGLGLPDVVLLSVLILLAAASAVTVAQRMMRVHSQLG
ncbi:phosphatidylinositol phosphate synthase [Zhihengliuella salsuginis]|uniref:Phosphatidylinositol phosphate synthase n=1 Tax=Zhihengliuella salsuginis TaxID=578222 RepID=A0ABQ3GKP5_9MICC|nr:CDP-alcohol phosphatidyltransferase family protein [Zhihengliuella salsuginis]GHD12040.1 CDP-alcohol phosphatidyltransferase [Zhihengliuella salsuginis]